jgi:hypothetical protein
VCEEEDPSQRLVEMGFVKDADNAKALMADFEEGGTFEFEYEAWEDMHKAGESQQSIADEIKDIFDNTPSVGD